MSKKVKSLLLVLCALVFAVAGVFATLAYLQDETQEIDNTMTVGDVDITLDETKITYDEYFEPTENGKTTEGNTYNLVPGVTYKKDPVVHVLAKSEPAYVFVRIINEIAAIEEKDPAGTTIADQMAALGWVEVKTANNIPGLVNDYEGLYVYNKTDVVDKPYIVNAKNSAANIDLAVFNEFTIDEAINNYGEGEGDPNLFDYKDKSVKIKAFAIQAAGGVNIETAAAQAKAAFDAADE